MFSCHERFSCKITTLLGHFFSFCTKSAAKRACETGVWLNIYKLLVILLLRSNKNMYLCTPIIHWGILRAS